MPDPTITYFPVSNGDTCLLKLADKTTFLIDMNVTEAGGDPDDPSRYDVHAHLLKELQSDADGRPHLDAFLLTHPDQDHLRGVPSVFYLGDPARYGKIDKDDGRIVVDELWFAPRIFWPWEEKDLSEDAKAFKKEVLPGSVWVAPRSSGSPGIVKLTRPRVGDTGRGHHSGSKSPSCSAPDSGSRRPSA